MRVVKAAMILAALAASLMASAGTLPRFAEPVRSGVPAWIHLVIVDCAFPNDSLAGAHVSIKVVSPTFGEIGTYLTTADTNGTLSYQLPDLAVGDVARVTVLPHGAVGRDSSHVYTCMGTTGSSGCGDQAVGSWDLGQSMVYECPDDWVCDPVENIRRIRCWYRAP